ECQSHAGSKLANKRRMPRICYPAPKTVSKCGAIPCPIAAARCRNRETEAINSIDLPLLPRTRSSGHQEKWRMTSVQSWVSRPDPCVFPAPKPDSEYLDECQRG